jgi:hypothetical protein
MIVSSQDSGIGMMMIGITAIGITAMAQAPFQYLSRSGINKEKRKQDSGDFSHGTNLGLLLFQRPLEHIALQLLRITSSASQSS